MFFNEKTQPLLVSQRRLSKDFKLTVQVGCAKVNLEKVLLFNRGKNTD